MVRPTFRPVAKGAVLAAIAGAVLTGALLTSAAPAAAAPQAQASTTCKPPKYPGDGYFTLLDVKGVSCATGSSFVRSYHACRVKSGRKGRCTKKVRGYTCKREVRTTIPTEINGRIDCRRGSKRIRFAYQQNT